VCPAIKHAQPQPACANFKGASCDACLIDVDDDEVVVISKMAPVLQPECVETSSKVNRLNRVCLFYNRLPQSAFDIATSYPELAKKLFPNGAGHPLVGVFLIAFDKYVIMLCRWVKFQKSASGLRGCSSKG
jgi:hypothetical protein